MNSVLETRITNVGSIAASDGKHWPGGLLIAGMHQSVDLYDPTSSNLHNLAQRMEEKLGSAETTPHISLRKLGPNSRMEDYHVDALAGLLHAIDSSVEIDFTAIEDQEERAIALENELHIAFVAAYFAAIVHSDPLLSKEVLPRIEEQLWYPGHLRQRNRNIVRSTDLAFSAASKAVDPETDHYKYEGVFNVGNLYALGYRGLGLRKQSNKQHDTNWDLFLSKRPSGETGVIPNHANLDVGPALRLLNVSTLLSEARDQLPDKGKLPSLGNSLAKEHEQNAVAIRTFMASQGLDLAKTRAHSVAVTPDKR